MGAAGSKEGPIGPYSDVFQVHRVLGKGAFGDVFAIQPRRRIQKRSLKKSHGGKGDQSPSESPRSGTVSPDGTSPRVTMSRSAQGSFLSQSGKHGSRQERKNKKNRQHAGQSLQELQSIERNRNATSPTSRSASSSSIEAGIVSGSSANNGRRPSTSGNISPANGLASSSGPPDTKSKLYAVKVLDKRAVVKAKMAKSVMTERDMLKSINHPLLVNVLATWQSDSDLFMMMDLMKGGDLRYPIRANRQRLDPERARFYTYQVLLALRYLNSKRIIHRDIKPDNLLLDSAGNCHLTDFNVSHKLSEDNDTVKQKAGTMCYIAPEVLGDFYDYKADVWSLAATAYEWMCGRKVFTYKSESELKAKIKAMQVKYPSSMETRWKDFLWRCFQPADKRLSVQQAIDDPLFSDLDEKACEFKTAKTPFTPLQQANIDHSADGLEQFRHVQGSGRLNKSREAVSSRDQAKFTEWDWLSVEVLDQLPVKCADRMAEIYNAMHPGEELSDEDSESGFDPIGSADSGESV
eukprot:TRINITY_DN406_c0_g1_i1.p1 TRINITY_DN406_c0_g1~~TRINITY_DN406_c0_g1_i1.p1  ORF type:complete len:520 (+),score=136.22 TRINITY_DN406_c0_g1_i1:171-1730(+)